MSKMIPLEDYEKLQAEFQAFTYIVSHDFSAPLRHIREFSKLLLERLEEHIGPDEQEFADFISKSTQHCETMIGGLLKLSRVSTHGSEFAAVDLQVLIEHAEKALAEKYAEHQPVITLETIPSIHGDEAQLYQLFYEIMENAILHSGSAEATIITISGSVKHNVTEIIVGDKGEAIAGADCETIFKPLKMLKRNNADHSIGIGLSVARAIAERHGGTIIAQPDPSGLGNNFVVSLKPTEKVTD